MLRATSEAVNYSLLRKSRPFALFVLGNFLLSFVLFFPTIILADRVQALRMGSPIQISFVYASFGLSNMLGRIIFGWISSAKILRSLTIFMINTVLFGLFIHSTLITTTMLEMYVGYFAIGVSFGKSPNRGAKRDEGLLSVSSSIPFN